MKIAARMPTFDWSEGIAMTQSSKPEPDGQAQTGDSAGCLLDGCMAAEGCLGCADLAATFVVAIVWLGYHLIHAAAGLVS